MLVLNYWPIIETYMQFIFCPWISRFTNHLVIRQCAEGRYLRNIAQGYVVTDPTQLLRKVRGRFESLTWKASRIGNLLNPFPPQLNRLLTTVLLEQHWGQCLQCVFFSWSFSVLRTHKCLTRLCPENLRDGLSLLSVAGWISAWC